jgi:putative membrane protein
MHWDGDGQDWSWAGMAAGMTIFWVLVAAVIFAAATWVSRASTHGAAGSSASEARRAQDAHAILAARLARGEIDVAEYESRSAALERAGA